MKPKKDILILIGMFFVALFLPLATILVKNRQDGQVLSSESSTSQISFKVSFDGIKPSSACLDSLNKIKTEVVNKSTNTIQSDIDAPLTPITNETNNNGDQVYLVSNLVLDSKFNNLNTSNYIRVRGPFHLTSRICLNNQSEKLGENIDCDINLTNTNTYDFSNYALMSGDLNQDGIVNSLDFSIIKNNLNSLVDISCGRTGDINLDGIVNSLDASLLKKFLLQKEEDRIINPNPTDNNVPTIKPTSTKTPTSIPTPTTKPSTTVTPTKTLTPTKTPTLAPTLTTTDKPTNTILTPTKTPTLTPSQVNPISSIQVRPDPLILEINKSWKAQISTTPEGLISGYIWKSSNGNIATINMNGLVKGKSVGEAKISAKVKGVNITSSINVLVKNTDNPTINPTINPTQLPTTTLPPVTAIQLRPNPLNLEIGSSWLISSSVTPVGLSPSYIWSSNNNTIATVGRNGLVTGITEGETTITAYVNNTNIFSSIAVVVTNRGNVRPTMVPTTRPTATPTKTPTEVSVNLTKQQMIDIEAGTIKLTYELFGASGNGEKDDSSEIRAAHDYANKLYAEKDILITVYGTSGKRYYIGAVSEPILVITNVDWRNATLIFDDAKIYNEAQLKTNVFKISTPLFYKTGKENLLVSETNASDIILKKNTTSLPKAIDSINSLSAKTDIKSINTYSELKKCSSYYVEAENTTINQYYRYGDYGAQQSKPQFDSFRIDSSGNITNDIIWDFSTVTSLKIYPIYNNQLSIQNAKIITRVKNMDKAFNTNDDPYYIARAIIVNRSNTLIKNINHILENEKEVGNKYGGILKLGSIANVNVNSFAFSPHKGHGTYDIGPYKAINITFNNCTDNKDINDTSVWGVWGGNFMKDIVVNNSRLNRIDAHMGIWNLTVNGSTIGIKGITVVGGGLLKVTNTKFVNSGSIIGLRNDYGDTWNGTITLDNITFTPSTSPAYLIKGTKVNWDFGYDTYFPKVIINDLTIKGTSNVYALGYTQESIKEPYTFLGDISLNNITSTNGIGIFDSDFTSKYLKKSSHNNQTVINISLTDVKLKQKTDIAQCKTLGTSCKFKFSISE